MPVCIQLSVYSIFFGEHTYRSAWRYIYLAFKNQLILIHSAMCKLILRFNLEVIDSTPKSVVRQKINYCYLCCARRRKSGCCCMPSSPKHRLKGRRPKSAAVKWKSLGKKWKTVGTKKPGEEREPNELANSVSLQSSQNLTFMIIAS